MIFIFCGRKLSHKLFMAGTSQLFCTEAALGSEGEQCWWPVRIVCNSPSPRSCCFVSGFWRVKNSWFTRGMIFLPQGVFAELLLGFPLWMSKLTMLAFTTDKTPQFVASLPDIKATWKLISIVYPPRVRKLQHCHNTFNISASLCRILKTRLCLDGCQKGTLAFEVVLRACPHSWALIHLFSS